MKLKVVVADDHPMVLEGIKSALQRNDDIDVVATTTSGAHVVTLVGRTQPDIALLDLHMPGRDGLESLEAIKKRHPGVKVVMISASQDPRDIERAFERGASAYIVKRVRPLDIASALRQIFEGTVYHPVDGRGSNRADDCCTAVGLTRRERTVLEAITCGKSTKTISGELWVTEQTVKYHLGNIYRKIGVTNRASALRWAFEHGVVEAR